MWLSRDLPVLDAVVGMLEDGPMVADAAITGRTGFDLVHVRRALGCAFGVAAAAVPAADLGARVGVQPGAEGFCGPLGEHVDGPAGLDVHQHGAVDMPL